MNGLATCAIFCLESATLCRYISPARRRCIYRGSRHWYWLAKNSCIYIPLFINNFFSSSKSCTKRACDHIRRSTPSFLSPFSICSFPYSLLSLHLPLQHTHKHQISLLVCPLTVSPSSDVIVINLRNSSQPEDTDTVEVLAFISVSVAHFNSARSPDMVPTVREI